MQAQNACRQQGSRNSPFPVSPRGKAGAGGFPPRRWHAVCQQKALAHIDAAAPPARGVSKRSAETPLAHPPDGRQRGRVQMVSLDLRDRAGEKIKDGRHVGLDFYDLLIEPIFPLILALFKEGDSAGCVIRPSGFRNRPNRQLPARNLADPVSLRLLKQPFLASSKCCASVRPKFLRLRLV